MYFISSPGDGRYGLLKLLNIASDSKFTLNDIDFSLPTRNEGQTDSRNTKVTLTFKSNKGFYGNKTIYYNRTHISNLPTLTINRNNATTYHAVINTINEDYNLFLTPSDIIDGPLPDIVSSSIVVTLPVNPNSYKVYSGIEIPIDLFEPDYVIFKPTDTLTQYLCAGFDSLAEYIDEDGSIYRVLVEANSYDCGYVDLNSRIRLIRPASLSILEEETSGIFTIEYVNPGDPITVTVTAPGLTISQSVFNLSNTVTTGTFTVTSNSPRVSTISVTSPADIPQPANTTFTFIDRYNTTYDVDSPNLSKIIQGQLTEEFVVTGYAVDPDEPVTVTIHTQNGLISTETSVLLTAAEPIATFKVSANNPGSYGISFTNNRNLINPTQLSISVLYPGNITITPPSVIANGIQSDVFTATLVNGIESIIVTPTFSGSNTVTPTSFILTPTNPTGTFRVTYNETGLKTLTITNNKSAINPAVYNFNVVVKPTLIVTTPTDPILSGINSDYFTITLINGYKSITVSLITNIGNISTTNIVLTPANPTGTFTVRSSVGGSYYVSFSNNGGLVNPINESITVEQVYNTSYNVTAPSQLNLIKDQPSGNFTVTGTNINPSKPITVSIGKTFGLTSNKEEVVLTSVAPTNTFNVQSDTEGDYVVTLTNNRSLTNPAPYNVNILNPGYLTITPPTGDFFVNVTSGNFTVSLVNGYQSIAVSLSSPGATFTPNTLNLTVANPTATFTVQYGSSGSKTITVNNNGITVNPAPLVLTLRAVPTITVTAPSGPLYEGKNSGNYTLTLNNGYKPVTVNVTSTTDLISENQFNLSPASPTATFTVKDATAGSYTLTFTNTEGYSIPASLSVTVVVFNGTTLFLTGPTGTYYSTEDSGNFTVSATNIVEPFVVTINTNADASSKYTINLSPGVTSSTFTVRFDTAGAGFVGITNDKDYNNPPDIEFTIINRPLAVLDLIQLAVNPLIRNKPHSFKASITNPFGITIVTPYTVGGGVVGGALNLSSGVPNSNFTFTPSNSGDYQIGITNNRSLTNPAPIDVTIINGEILLRIPNTNLSAINQTDWFEVEMVNFETNTVIEIGLTNYSDGSVYIDPTDVYQTTKILLTNGNRIGKFKLTKPTSGLVTISITNNYSLINPTPVELSFYNPPRLLLTAPVINEAFTNSNIGLFTVTLEDYVTDTNVEIFSDPLTDDTYKNNVVLFLNFQGNTGSLNFKDYSNQNYVINNYITDVLNPTIALSEFEPINGFTSLQYVAGSDYIGITELNNNFAFNSDFTIEVAFKTTSAGKMLLDMNSISGAYWYLWINLSGNIEWRSSVTVTPIKSTALVNDGQPHEVTFTRTGSAIKLFLDGIVVDTFTNNGTFDSTAPTLYIGAQVTNRDVSKDYVGYISKVKITKGTGRWNTDYVVTPLKIAKFTPNSFTLTNLDNVETFNIAVSTSGQYPVSIKNNTGAINPNSANVTFYKTPTVVLTLADSPYYVGEQSKNFTISLLNPSLLVTFTITKDVGLSFIETPHGLIGNTFTLDSNTPSTTFTLKADTIGTFSLALTNNKNLNNVDVITYTTVNRTILALSLTSPEITNIEINNTSDNFTVTLLGTVIQDVLVTPVATGGLIITPTSFILNQTNKTSTFTVECDTPGTYTVTLNNDSGLETIEPSSFDFTFRIRSNISVTNTPNKIFMGVESGDFEITLNNPYEEVTVTPTLLGAVFSPTSILLTPEEPVGTFTATVNSYGYKTIVLQSLPIIDIVNNSDILVLPELNISSITIEPPPAVFINVLSGDFTITLNNGPWKSLDEFGAVSNVTWDGNNEIALSVQPNPIAFIPKEVEITLISDATGFTKNTVTLDVIDNVDTFKLNSSISGIFEITTSNNGDITNSAPVEFNVGAELEVELLVPNELFYKTKISWPFTVSVPLLNSNVIITPVSTNPNIIFVPTSTLLTPEEPVGTFQFKSNDSGLIDITITNNLGFTNPDTVTVTVINIDKFHEYTELLLLPKVTALTNESYNSSPITVSGPTISNSSAFYPNDINRPSKELFSSNGDRIVITTNDEKFFSFDKEFTFEFIIKRQSSPPGVYTLLDFNNNTKNGRGLVFAFDNVNNKIIILNNQTIFYQTANNSIPNNFIWHYLLFEFINGILSIYIDSGSGTVKIGETPIRMFNLSRIGFIIGGASNLINGVYYNLLSTCYDAIRFTSKARYNGSPIGLTDLTQRYLSVGSPSLRIFLPTDLFLGKNIISKPFTVTGYLLNKNVTITPTSTGNVTFSPTNVIITPASPTATFTFISNEPGDYTVTINNDSYLECQDSFNITIIESDVKFNNVILLLNTDGLINNYSGALFKDISKFNRSFLNSSEGQSYLIKSDYSKYNKSVELLNTNSSWGGHNYSTTDSLFDFSNTNFCIEGNCYFNELYDTVTEGTIFDTSLASNLTSGGFRIIVKPSVNKLLIAGFNDTTYLIPEENTPGTLPGKYINFAFAVEFINGTLSIYIDGVLYASAVTNIPTRVGGQSVRLGASSKGSLYYFPGGIDQLRITRDAYRYGNNYTVSNKPFLQSGLMNISLTKPVGDYNIFNTEVSKIFTLTTMFIKDPCVITFQSNVDGIVFNPPTLTILPISPNGTFTVSGIPGEYVITFKNSLLIDFNEVLNITIFDSTETTIDLNTNILKQVFDTDTVNLNTVIHNSVSPVKFDIITDPLYDDPYRDNVVLMLDFQNEEKIINHSGNSFDFTITGSNTSITSIDKIYGKNSLKIGSTNNATNGTLLINNTGPDLDVFNFPDDFTIEIDFRVFPGTGGRLFYFSTTSGRTISTLVSNGSLYVGRTANGWWFIISIDQSYQTIKIAISRTNGVVRLFKNGIQQAAPVSDNATLISNSQWMTLGGYRNNDAETPIPNFSGVIGKVRITKGIGRYITDYTPDELNYPTFIPSLPYQFTKLDNEQTFSVTSSVKKQYSLIPVNNRKLLNPTSFLLGFNIVPTIRLVTPTNLIIPKSDKSLDYFITLSDSSTSPVIVTVILDSGILINEYDPTLSLVGTNKFLLNNQTVSVKLNFLSDTVGNYNIALINDRGLINPDPILITVKIPDIFIIGPNPANELYVDESSFDLSVGIDVVTTPITIVVSLSSGLSFDDLAPEIKTRNYIVSPEVLNYLFKIISSNNNTTQQITVTNLNNVNNPNALDIFVIDRPGIPNNLETTDFNIYMVGEDTDNRDINLFQGFF